MVDKVRLVIPDEKLKDFSQFRHLSLRLGRKRRRRGRNLYKRQLAQIRRVLR